MDKPKDLPDIPVAVSLDYVPPPMPVKVPEHQKEPEIIRTFIPYPPEKTVEQKKETPILSSNTFNGYTRVDVVAPSGLLVVISISAVIAVIAIATVVLVLAKRKNRS